MKVGTTSKDSEILYTVERISKEAPEAIRSSKRGSTLKINSTSESFTNAQT